MRISRKDETVEMVNFYHSELKEFIRENVDTIANRSSIVKCVEENCDRFVLVNNLDFHQVRR